MTVEIKEKSEEHCRIPDYLNVFCSSGSKDALPMGKDERRWFIVEEKKGDDR